MGTPGQLERDTQSKREQLQSADTPNGVDRRVGNRVIFGHFQRRVEFWANLENELPEGPSGLQMAVMLDDLSEHWNELRKRACRRAPYDS